MVGGLVNIVLKAIAQGSGFEKHTKNAKELTAQVRDLSQAGKKLGMVFGTVGGAIGDLFANILKGGIWGVMASLGDLAVKAWGKWSNSAKEAAEAVAKAEHEAHDARLKHLDDFADKAAKVDAARKATIKENLKRINDEIDATKELTRATLELARADARRRGDKAAVVRLDEALGRVDPDASKQRLENEIDAARKTVEASKKKMADLSPAVAAASSGVSLEKERIKQAIADVREEAAKNATGKVYSAGPGVVAYMTATEEERKAAADAAEARFRESEEYANLAKHLDDATKKQKELAEKYSSAEKEISFAEATLPVLEKRLKALDMAERAKAENRDQDEREKEAEEVKKFETEKKRLEKSIADERRKLQLEAAKERERLDREAHQKRMEDLRKEIAAQKSAASVLSGRAASATSEFDKAFAMYRDPSRAAAEIGEEKDYQSDLDRLHLDARRYGGKWRIDELSRLMAAGDTQGVTDTLKDWRKVKGFTPEVEAMVRASAAENAKTTVEDELRKIETNTAGLAKKLEELISMKGSS